MQAKGEDPVERQMSTDTHNADALRDLIVWAEGWTDEGKGWSYRARHKLVAALAHEKLERLEHEERPVRDYDALRDLLDENGFWRDTSAIIMNVQSWLAANTQPPEESNGP
jgi:hypothetical protein